MNDGFLFKINQLCIPRGYLREHIICELHSGGLASHVGRDKIIDFVEDKYYWVSMKKDVENLGNDALYVNKKRGTHKMHAFVLLFPSQMLLGLIYLWILS